MTKPLLLTLLAVAGAAALGGCGGSHATPASAPAAKTAAVATSTPAASSSATACDLVDRSAFAKALGAASVHTAGRSSSAAGISDCDVSYGGASFELTLDTATGGARYAAARETYTDPVDVPGIGDKAFVAAESSRCSALKGNAQILVTITLDPDKVSAVCPALLSAAAKGLS